MQEADAQLTFEVASASSTIPARSPPKIYTTLEAYTVYEALLPDPERTLFAQE